MLLNIDERKNIVYYLILGLILIFLFHFLLVPNVANKWLIALLFISSILVISFNLNYTYLVFITLIFVPYLHTLKVHPAVIFSLIMLVITLIHFNGVLSKSIENPLWKPLLIYFILTLPSLVNSHALILSLRDLSNLISLLISFFVTLIIFSLNKKMINIFYYFVSVILLHTLYVIYLGLTTKERAFGILGVYYIDFAGLASVVTFILLLYHKGFKKLIFTILFTVITFGLILTQTRNAWISTSFAIITLIIYLYFNNEKTFIRRYVLSLITVFIIVLLFLLFINVSETVNKRLEVAQQTVTLTDDPESIGMNSIISRVMIWHTAVSAYLEYPVIGIGAYAFKHTSQLFYVIPKGFYKLYVEGRTPHITYLQVLTETGIVGFIAFIFFIYSLVRYIIQSLKLPKKRDELIITMMICWSLIYIVFSMMMTESWIYGPYIVWFGVLLGLLVNNRKYLEKFY